MKEHMVWLYRQSTRIQRHRALKAMRLAGQVPVGILFYHRVADTHPNAWTLSRRDFARQLDWLQETFDIVDLAEAQRRLRTGVCKQPTVCLTFDDGYAENADFAIAELARRKLPATYFVSTEFVRTGKSFPHDLALGTALAPNSVAQLREFSELGIEIAAHTRSHPDLGKVLDAARIDDEIYGSICDLQNWLGRPVRYFAFPFGQVRNFTQLAIDAVARAGLAGFCSAYGDWNWPGQNSFHLRRIHADPGLQRLKNWLTYDPRKLRQRREFPYVDAPMQRLTPMPADVKSGCLLPTENADRIHSQMEGAPLPDPENLHSQFMFTAN